MSMREYALYSDGGCSGNPGPGGWGYVIKEGAAPLVEASGGEALTTNNRMELKACIEGLKAILAKEGFDASKALAVVYTDSQYVQKGMSEWIKGWKAKSWVTANKEPVKNAELWRELDELASRLTTVFRWVKGHAGNPLNERCDALTQMEIAKFKRT
jgi:ribonuclease HI